MAIKLIAIDMDGTLLNNNGKVSEKNRQTLLKAMDAGIFIVPATGRMRNGLPEELQEMAGVSYLITSNGAAVYEVGKEEPLCSALIPAEELRILLDAVLEFDLIVEIYINGQGYYEKSILERLSEFDVPEFYHSLYATRKHGVESMAEFIKNQDYAAEKMNLPWLKEGVKEKLLERLQTLPNFSLTSSLKENVEINYKDVNKGNGLKALAKVLGLRKEEIMAIGDNENDTHMLLEAGTAVAMGNATSQIKEISTFVTKTNEEDGVSYAIESLVFGNDQL